MEAMAHHYIQLIQDAGFTGNILLGGKAFLFISS
jgi:hypothetical protein